MEVTWLSDSTGGLQSLCSDLTPLSHHRVGPTVQAALGYAAFPCPPGLLPASVQVSPCHSAAFLQPFVWASQGRGRGTAQQPHPRLLKIQPGACTVPGLPACWPSAFSLGPAAWGLCCRIIRNKLPTARASLAGLWVPPGPHASTAGPPRASWLGRQVPPDVRECLQHSCTLGAGTSQVRCAPRVLGTARSGAAVGRNCL